jgi:hypothetical protein
MKPAMPRLLREWMVDGLLVAFNLSTPPGMIETIRRHNIPSIWLNSDQEIDCVRPNDEGRRLRCGAPSSAIGPSPHRLCDAHAKQTLQRGSS